MKMVKKYIFWAAEMLFLGKVELDFARRSLNVSVKRHKVLSTSQFSQSCSLLLASLFFSRTEREHHSVLSAARAPSGDRH